MDEIDLLDCWILQLLEWDFTARVFKHQTLKSARRDRPAKRGSTEPWAAVAIEKSFAS